MTVVNFATADELAQYVVTQSVPQASIVTIMHQGGRWWLFYM